MDRTVAVPVRAEPARLRLTRTWETTTVSETVFGRLLGLFVNSSGRAHGRNARRLVHAARQQDRRLAIALLAAAVAHTPEAEEVLRGARMRMARKPSAVARELLRNFPKSGSKRRRRRSKGDGNGAEVERERLAEVDSEDGAGPAEEAAAEPAADAASGSHPDG